MPFRSKSRPYYIFSEKNLIAKLSITGSPPECKTKKVVSIAYTKEDSHLSLPEMKIATLFYDKILDDKFIISLIVRQLKYDYKKIHVSESPEIDNSSELLE